ncbi:dimethylhistidine N-methyltransferase [Andreprevotia lacus DSM 23236]|jgi:dimethylhistidine N-methyltransferase|uniref:Dimethylhistidine N-methyltransferase n=1 Tax=Andreprevotia lacus DSM 23236 TaxID=1121001 RepID=A0A1W1X2F3_9NEIS|nr:L-histidine N(alpha)-methyltransferase [Andreprevotia lacus]SMC17940.1 dimethylhistidine N-methyltransferase [Andreprevotia lacus DSM 23236]
MSALLSKLLDAGSARPGFVPMEEARAAPELHLHALESPGERLQGLLAGLLAEPAQISPKFFYDAQGCAIYSAICELAEYYPTRTEAAIFAQYRREIAACLPCGAQWVDLGCGDGAKAWGWLDVAGASRYIGVDIAQDWLAATLQAGHKRFPHVGFAGVVTDFTRPFSIVQLLMRHPEHAPVFFYPGSSIGNFEPEHALGMLRTMCEHLGCEGRLLIGVDAPKPRDALEAAYDDALGITAAFNLNVLRVVNRELGCALQPQDFRHRAVYNEAAERIEMHLVAQRSLQLNLAGVVRHFAAGEAIVTEHSYKYTPARFAALLAEAGFGTVQRWSDGQGWFNVYVAAPAGACA